MGKAVAARDRVHVRHIGGRRGCRTRSHHGLWHANARRAARLPLRAVFGRSARGDPASCRRRAGLGSGLLPDEFPARRAFLRGGRDALRADRHKALRHRSHRQPRPDVLAHSGKRRIPLAHLHQHVPARRGGGARRALRLPGRGQFPRARCGRGRARRAARAVHGVSALPQRDRTHGAPEYRRHREHHAAPGGVRSFRRDGVRHRAGQHAHRCGHCAHHKRRKAL